eukprot:g5200.t1
MEIYISEAIAGVLYRINQHRLRRRREDLFFDDDDWILADDAVPNAEELRRCFRRWWRWPAKTALVALLLAWWLGEVVEYHSAQVKGLGMSPPAAFASAAGSPVLPTEGQVEEMLQPLEGKCFTYSPINPPPTEEDEDNEDEEEGDQTTPTAGPFVFQWCHGGAATVRVEGEGARVPKQYDFGTSEETAVFPVWEDEIRIQPRDQGQEQEEPGQNDGRRSFPAGNSNGDGGWGGGTPEEWFGEDCPTLVASVCTYLLCGAYGTTTTGGVGRGADGEAMGAQGVAFALENAPYQRPPPAPFVSWRQRGFVDYDRRKPMGRARRLELREEVREMFVHSYDGYMRHAFPGGELLPLSCESGELHLVKVPLVTLVDSLDALAIMGNATEFRRAVRLVADGLDVEADVDVSVFESNIRMLGGLLSAHLLASDPALGLYGGDGGAEPRNSRHDGGSAHGERCEYGDGEVEGTSDAGRREGGAGGSRCFGDNDAYDEFCGGGGSAGCRAVEMCGGSSKEEEEAEEKGESRAGEEGGERYDGELLVLAEKLGRRLLPAFETSTGIPYGTVNLKRGVPLGETTVSSLAGAGSLSVEFSVLSALTGDGSFSEAAEGAVKALYRSRSGGLGLLGKHIDSRTGKWTETNSGIGTNGDSFYEYLLKMYVLWGDLEYWDMFMQCYLNVQRFLREGDWYAGTEMEAGALTSRTLDNLMAFWPGMQTIMGEAGTSWIGEGKGRDEAGMRPFGGPDGKAREGKG